MLKDSKKFYPPSTLKTFKMNAPANVPILETRKGKYEKTSTTPEFFIEANIRESIKQELREFFLEDMISNPQKIEALIQNIRERQWKCLNDIPDEFMLNIDTSEIVVKESFLKKIQQERSKYTTDEQIQIENILTSKYKQSIGDFRISANHNIERNLGQYEIKLKYKTNQWYQPNKDKKYIDNGYKNDDDNQSHSSMDIEEAKEFDEELQNKLDQQDKLEEFFLSHMVGEQLKNESSTKQNDQDITLITEKEEQTLNQVLNQVTDQKPTQRIIMKEITFIEQVSEPSSSNNSKKNDMKSNVSKDPRLNANKDPRLNVKPEKKQDMQQEQNNKQSLKEISQQHQVQKEDMSKSKNKDKLKKGRLSNIEVDQVDIIEIESSSSIQVIGESLQTQNKDKVHPLNQFLNTTATSSQKKGQQRLATIQHVSLFIQFNQNQIHIIKFNYFYFQFKIIFYTTYLFNHQIPVQIFHFQKLQIIKQ